MLRRWRVVLLALAGVLGGTVPAWAACTVSTTPVAFGLYSVFAAIPLDGTGQVIYRCGPGDKNITVTLDRGGAATFAGRRMLKGTEPLSYNLYVDAARSVIWGDGTGGTQVHFEKNPPPNRDVILPVYGRIPAGQDVSAGVYVNTVVATILF